MKFNKKTILSLLIIFILIGSILITILPLLLNNKTSEIVVFETNRGIIEVELYRDKAPITVENFIKYIQNFTDHIRGVERFNDPFAGKEVELFSGYGRAFANNLGEYIVTHSPSYNPNIGSNLHWEELRPAR